MKLKRTIAALLLVLTIAASFSACGDNDVSSSTTVTTTAKEPSASGTQTPTLPPALSGNNGEWEGPHDSSFNEIKP